MENVDHVFSGEGGLYVSGRWNHMGRKVVYCSQSVSLCTLEWLSHNGLSVSGFSYHRFSISIPVELIFKLALSDLPKAWNATPSTDITRDFAETHLFNHPTCLAIAIPSVIVPEEFNLVINPMHAAYDQVKQSVCALGKYVAPKRVV